MNVHSLPSKAVSVFVSGCLALSLATFALPSVALADDQVDQPVPVSQEPAAPEAQEQEPALDPVQENQQKPDASQKTDSTQDQQLPQGNNQQGALEQSQDQNPVLPVELEDGLQQDELGNWIYLENGQLVKGEFRDVVEGSDLDGRYYFNLDGFAVSGLQTIDGKLYYFDEQTFKAAHKAWMDLDGKRYRFGANYYALTEGLWNVDGKLYYIGQDQTVLTGWKSWDDGTKSYFSPKHNGAAAKAWWIIDGARYYFHKTTSKAYRGLWWIGDKRFFFNKTTSQMYTGWKTWDSGSRSYFSPKHNGAAAKAWWTINGKRYYFKPSTRMTVRGLQTINGKRYCFKNNGVMRTDWYQWPNGKWSFFGKNGVMRVGVKYIYGMQFNFVNGKAKITNTTKFNMCRKAQKYTSPTSWLILVDLTHQYMGVFSGSQGKWVLKKYWICSSGMPGITATVASENHAIGYRGYSFGDETYTCYWYTQFFKRCLFHSSPYIPGTNICMDSTMGVPSSRGCIRLRIDRAKWIHDFMPRDTRVVTYGRV